LGVLVFSGISGTFCICVILPIFPEFCLFGVGIIRISGFGVGIIRIFVVLCEYNRFVVGFVGFCGFCGFCGKFVGFCGNFVVILCFLVFFGVV